MANKDFPALLPTVVSAISPEVELLLFVGSTSSNTQESIVYTTPIVTGKLVYNGPLKTSQLDWGDIFPIEINENVTKTIIELEGCAVVTTGTGTTNDHVGKGRIEINWETGNIVGWLNYSQGDDDESSMTMIMDDVVATGTIDAIDLDTTGLGSLLGSQLIITENTIVALPMYPRPAAENQLVKYTITHYKTQDKSGWYSGYTYFPEVTALPTSDRNLSTCYRLTADDPVALAPPGVYMWNGTGWLCLSCFSTYALDAWTGAVVTTLISGVDYTVVVGGNVTSLTIDLQTIGVANVMGANPSGYDIPVSPVGMYGMGSAVLADAFESMSSTQTDWGLFIQKTGSQLYGAAQKVGT